MRNLGLSVLLASLLAGCDIVENLPVVTPGPVTIAPGNVTNVLTATITRNGARLPASLIAACEIDEQITPTRFRALASITAIQGPGTSFSCLIPNMVSRRITSAHNIRTRWQVFSPRQGQPPLKIAETPHVETQLGCDAAARTVALNAMRDAAFRALPLTSLPPTAAGLPQWTFEDITRNIYAATHGPVQFEGMGVAFIRKPAAGVGAVASATGMNFGLPNPTGAPDLLLFLPRPGANVTDLIPDDPYTLVGWAFAQTITGARTPLPPTGAPAATDPASGQQRRPILTCVRHHEWMIHAKGVHRLDGRFSVGAGSAFGIEHNALWDVHFFLSPAGSPAGVTEVAITRSRGGLITGGVPFDANAFFHPTAYD
jgi:hypothetical protein